MDELFVIPECYADTNLIETLVPPNKRYHHGNGCNVVAKVMQEKAKECFAIGIVDKDKKQNSYFKGFIQIANTNSLFLLKHPARPHYLILISPAIERFMLACADEMRITLENYNLPSGMDLLKKKTKDEKAMEDTDLKRFFKAIKKSHECSVLKEWIEHLKANTYHSCDEALRQIAGGRIKTAE